MKTLAEIRNEWQERQRSRMVFSNGFRRQLMEDGWCRLKRDDEVIEGETYGTADGLVKIMKKTEDNEEWWGKIIKPSHGETKEGDVFSYRWDELFVGQHKNKDKWQVDALRDEILDTPRHKNVDKIDIKPTQEERILFERTLDDNEIENLIDKARESALAIKKDKKRDKEEREQAKEVLDFIDDVEGIWDEKKSLHPSQVVSLMKIVAGTSSTNKAGWGWKTSGFKKSPDGKVPQDFRNEELTEGKMTDGIIKAGALMTKRYIINKGQEGDVSAQINGLASLILFSIAATDKGESFMSKALATSGFFKGATKK